MLARPDIGLSRDLTVVLQLVELAMLYGFDVGCFVSFAEKVILKKASLPIYKPDQIDESWKISGHYPLKIPVG